MMAIGAVKFLDNSGQYQALVAAAYKPELGFSENIQLRDMVDALDDWAVGIDFEDKRLKDIFGDDYIGLANRQNFLIGQMTMIEKMVARLASSIKRGER